MNICFLTANFIRGGIGRVTSIIANELHTKKEINCYGLGHTNNNQKDNFKTIFPVQYIFHENISMRDAMLKKHYIKKIKEFVIVHNISVLVACDELFYPAAIIVARLCRIKVICWEHTNPYVTTDHRFEKAVRHFGGAFSDCNLLLTKQAKKIFDEWYPHKNNIQIYNPIDSKLYAETRRYNETSKKIISVGRLFYQKNFQRMIGIATKILQEYSEWEWDIYGDGPDEFELRNLIQQNNMENNIHLCGHVDDLYERYNQYSFIVMTSRYEGFPMTLLEASVSGLPMIAFDVLTGPREIISDGKNGFLCNEKSDEDMIDKIGVLIKDVKLRNQMSKESKYKAERFQLNKICNQWLDLLQDIV